MNSRIGPATVEDNANRRERYRRAAERLADWAREDPQYDERIGDLSNES